MIAGLIDGATVNDEYVPVKAGQKKARYINIRTLCNALDDVKMQVARTLPNPQPTQPLQENAA